MKEEKIMMAECFGGVSLIKGIPAISCCQSDKFYNHLGDKSPDPCLRDYPG